jgi:hypothetical protein
MTDTTANDTHTRPPADGRGSGTRHIDAVVAVYETEDDLNAATKRLETIHSRLEHHQATHAARGVS